MNKLILIESPKSAASIPVTRHKLLVDIDSGRHSFAIGEHAIERAQLTADDTVLIIGTGPIGLGILR